jgi:transposase InsO family protein
VKVHFIRPGKPTENAFVESFNGRFRDECLNENWFTNLLDARTTIDFETPLQRGEAAQLAIRIDAAGVLKPLPRTDMIAGRKRGAR